MMGAPQPKRERRKGPLETPSDQNHSTCSMQPANAANANLSGDFGVIVFNNPNLSKKELLSSREPNTTTNDVSEKVASFSEWIGMNLCCGYAPAKLDHPQQEEDSILSHPSKLERQDGSLLTDVSFLTDASLMDLELDREQEDMIELEMNSPPRKERKKRLPAFRKLKQFDQKSFSMRHKLKSIKTTLTDNNPLLFKVPNAWKKKKNQQQQQQQ